VLYEWDLDKTAQFDDATGAVVVFPATAVGQFPVALRSRTTNGAWSIDTATVVVGNPTLTAEAGGPLYL